MIKKHFDGRTANLARALGIARQSVTGWDLIPGDRAIAIEFLTKGKVKAVTLRPDLKLCAKK